MPRTKQTKQYISQIANMLQGALEASKMTQRDLAAHLNVSEQRVCQMLNGEANLTIQTLFKIASAMKMELVIGLHGKE